MGAKARPDRRHEARLRRGRLLWDVASLTYYGIVDRLCAPLRELAVRRLDLRDGQAVLDIGCGSGATLASLRAAVGERGRVVGVDYSPRMVARARRLVRERGWTNVEVRQADASRTAHGVGEFDAVVALAAFSAMPDVRTAVGHARDALRPGGKLFVYDLRPVGKRLTARVFRRVYAALAGFTGADVLAELGRAFPMLEPIFTPGPKQSTITLVLATKTQAEAGTTARA
ncbi:class I SAM-dependent methyltransferase [Actinokineospora sp. NBRC 105648]|uniref:class I SAM-dependent methyltransferase n=1 Tax=Actinokineospora sp. NBRC 105648 TaxID=3032206 RepID=UPI0024A30566|nr:class I SAM-dependent methyltransferase [Actinokineospora sp. NBRC 105648]GLZ40454.1 hypothetical protein Acsp05_40780 [Actinokineospora sp. NBRC 105648]